MSQIKVIFYSCFFLLALGSCKKKTCKDFHKGVFQSQDEKMKDITIYRNDSTQTEISEERGIKDVFSITWVNDCEYYLVLKESKTPDKNLLNELDTLRVSITAIEEDKYQFTAFLNGKKFVNDLKQISSNPE